MREEAEAIFVTPYWPSQSWFPIIMDLAMAVPRLLRPSPDLLTSPLGESHPLVQDDSIRLIVWKLSDSALLERFRRRFSPHPLRNTKKYKRCIPERLEFLEKLVLRGKRIPCLLAPQI
jgi:hypothetical protein